MTSPDPTGAPADPVSTDVSLAISPRRGTNGAVVQTREDRLVAAMVGASGAGADAAPDLEVVALLYGLAEACVDLLGAAAANVQIADAKGVLRTLATFGESERCGDFLAAHVHDGPGAESFRQASVISVELSSGEVPPPQPTGVIRWASFGSVYGIPMAARQQVLGAVTILRHEPTRLDPTELAIAEGIAAVATSSLVHDRAHRSAAVTREQLEGALSSRIMIEQAKGYLARAHDESPDNAFVRLRRYARAHHLRITHVADQVVFRSLDLA